MDPLSTPVAFAASLPPLPARGAGSAAGQLQASGSGALPASVGQVRTGAGGLSARQIAVGSGNNRERAQGAMAAIKSLFSGLTHALWAVVMSPVALARSIASYAMTCRAAAPRPAADTGSALREAIAGFHAQAVLLTGALSREPVLAQAADVPRGLHATAVKDWSRWPGVVIDGETYGAAHFAGVRDAHAAAMQLTQMCNGNAAAAEWISRFANQQMGMPLTELLLRLPIGPNGESGFFLNDPTLTPRIARLDDGSVEVTISLDWEARNTPALYLDPGAPVRVQADGRLTAGVALRFELPADNTSVEMPRVSISKPLEWTADIRPAASATDA